MTHSAEQGGELEHPETAVVVGTLLDAEFALMPLEFIAQHRARGTGPGLYGWWVNAKGAGDLAVGSGLPMPAGQIYVGLAGATKWPSGKVSSSTLWTRIRSRHLRGRRKGSTLRRRFGAIFAEARVEHEAGESVLTAWRHAHLRVHTVVFGDRNTLGRLESSVLGSIDPRLNLVSEGLSPRLRACHD